MLYFQGDYTNEPSETEAIATFLNDYAEAMQGRKTTVGGRFR